MTIVAALRFETPWGGLLALLAVVPLAANVLATRRDAAGRSALGLPRSEPRRFLVVGGLVAAPLLLALAATEPAITTHTGRRIRTDAQAVFIFDTTRSMAAAPSFTAPTRLQQAQRLAVELRDAIPDVPSGVASLTTELLPHLFPTASEEAFASTVRASIGIERPPPPFLQYGVRGTSFAALTQLRSQGFFTPTTRKRVAVLLTDGESGAVDMASVGKTLTDPAGYPPRPPIQTPGLPINRPEPTVSLLVIRVGGVHDRIYDADGQVEGAYRPDPAARSTVAALTSATHGRSFTGAQARSAIGALRAMAGSGRGTHQGTTEQTHDLGRYLALCAVLPLGLLLGRRYLTQL